MRSWGQTASSYEPEVWEFEYRVHRYLGRVPETELRLRYDAIVRNLQSIVSDERNPIPIHTFLSSWYWYRKEHLTRYEFFLRGLPLHRPLPVVSRRDLLGAPARQRSPNAGDVLFRYGPRRWMQELLDFGRLRMLAARDYAQMETDPARQDDELTKHAFSPGAYVTLTLPDGSVSRPIGDVRYSHSGTDYFVYCVSNDWDTDLFNDFGADACVIIKNPDAFAQRLENVGKRLLPDWYFHHCPIEYFDTYERRSKERIDNAMSKDFRFAYQREYRFLFAGFGKEAKGAQYLELGSLSDIAELYLRP
jgi:hypothetical protein